MILLVGNWKMAPEKPVTAIDLIKKTLAIAKLFKNTVSIVSCVPYIHIPLIGKLIKLPLSLGAQTVTAETDPANTGLISASMLKAAQVTYCIVGHSEVRARGENNDEVCDKVSVLLEKKITPIICVGERARDAQGWYLSEVKDQIETVLGVLSGQGYKKVVIAYEPVWAIGAHAAREATPTECLEMVIYIRKIFADHIGEKAAASIRILYGGSVNELNAKVFLREAKVQGFLVGRVSLEPKRLSALALAIST